MNTADIKPGTIGIGYTAELGADYTGDDLLGLWEGDLPPGLELDLSDFDAGWHPLVTELALGGAHVAAVGDVADAAGRVVGPCVAEVTRGTRTAFIVDSRDADADATGPATLRRRECSVSSTELVSPDLIAAACSRAVRSCRFTEHPRSLIKLVAG